ncbi:hypothetical protein TIFTF001_019763 [Ficus carica]|uniref:Uncharacterized protein n=1 Tax=Ficus carica TaxID=3494 RepID=A0AA88AX80_FICCA|nr:hypothetical protein TIFTF001_019763 [Ficus carica]
MAARAHDVAALTIKGTSAILNFPELAGSLPRPDSASPRDGFEDYFHIQMPLSEPDCAIPSAFEPFLWQH